VLYLYHSTSYLIQHVLDTILEKNTTRFIEIELGDWKEGPTSIEVAHMCLYPNNSYTCFLFVLVYF
jgi:hypothetical protein